MRRFHLLRNRPGRRGATTVEMAVVLPVFVLLLFSLMEFSHAYMVVSMLNAATTRAAREGVADGVSTSTVEQKVKDLMGKALQSTSKVTVHVKDASTFDSSNVNPTKINYSALPAIELKNATSRQLFIVRAEVNYEDVSLFKPKWVKGIVLSGQAVMRHE